MNTTKKTLVTVLLFILTSGTAVGLASEAAAIAPPYHPRCPVGMYWNPLDHTCDYPRGM